LALCAGVGGLELGLKLALGETYRTVGYVERDAYAAAVLVARMDDAALDRAPVWDDVTTFRGAPWRGVVDLISAGFPCEPWSDAGRRLGVRDHRWLWPFIARVVHEVGPRLVFLENVPAIALSGLQHVLGDLASLGFDAEWTVLGAAHVGASHRRDRLFLLADADRDRREGLPDAERGARATDVRRRPGPARGAFPPGPHDDAWTEILAVRPDLAPAEPRVPRMADGLAPWVDRVRAVGHGVVPRQAAEAFRILAGRFRC
jgi:DNA (cytosine-5)-methyltransferase 1